MGIQTNYIREHISCNLIRYNYCNINYLAQLNITMSIKITHQFHLKSTSAMLLTGGASVKLSHLKKKKSQFLFRSNFVLLLDFSIRNLNFFSPLFLTPLSLSPKHRNRSKQPDLKLGFKSCIEFKLWKQPYL